MNRDDGLEGKVAVISGGGSGIGRALAVAYARAGAHSVIGYLPSRPARRDGTVRAVEEAGGRCVAVPMDVRRFEDTEKLAQAALDEFGRLDIAVAAAGILRRAPLADMTDEAWDDMMAVDLSGVLRVFRSCSTRMDRRRGDGRHVLDRRRRLRLGRAQPLCRRQVRTAWPVPVSGRGAGPAPDPGQRHHSGAHREPAVPGPGELAGPEGLDAAGSIIPWGRVGNVDEAARAIRFLTSDDSAYITGQQLIVDGGLTVRWPS